MSRLNKRSRLSGAFADVFDSRESALDVKGRL